jgi:hypothetical protein
MSPLYRTTVGIARKHSRMSLIAAAAGALGAAGFAAGAAPWAQAIDNVAKTVQGGSPSTSGQPGTSLIEAVTKLDAIRSAGTGGSTGTAAATDNTFTKNQAAVTGTAFVRHATDQAAKPTAAKPNAAKQQAARQQAARQQAARQQAAKAKAAKAKAATAASAQPYLIYDSVTPGTIPAGRAAAVYANGAYASSSAQLAGHNSVLWIDTNGSDPAANALDVEPGDATPAGAAQWVQQRLSSLPHSVAIVYTMMSDWQQVKDNVATLPTWMQSKVRYWIADPTGVPHVVAGASATQWYWGNSYDITTANPDFVR